MDGKQFLIYGKCQGGKTGVIQCVALCHILFSKASSLIILDNSTDGANQLQDRSDQFINSHQQFTKEQGFIGNSISYLYVGSCENEEIEDALSGKTKKMIICIANDTQMTKIQSALEKIDKPSFVTFIDEADSIICGSESAAFRQKIPWILEKSGRSYAVTATTFDLLFSQDKIESANTLVIDPPRGIYKGLRQIELRALEEKAIPANNANPFLKNDPSLWPFLTYYTNKTPYGEGFCSIRHKNVHPVICLIKTTHLNAFQDKLAKLIR